MYFSEIFPGIRAAEHPNSQIFVGVRTPVRLYIHEIGTYDTAGAALRAYITF